MQIIKFVRTLVFLLFPLASFSQSSYIPLGTKDYKLLDRLEIKTGNSNLNYSTIKPYNRRLVTKEVEAIDSMYNTGDSAAYNLTTIDKYNIQSFLMNNSEWSVPRKSYNSKKPILNSFYKNKRKSL